ncbi:MAG: porin, partial [Sulfurospirillum cavolei]|nr:porin [Sulfurospirillum cavolei]
MWINFKTRTSYLKKNDVGGNAPSFEKRAIFNGVSASDTYQFDDAYTLALINKSISNLTLTAQYANVGDVVATNTKDV